MNAGAVTEFPPIALYALLSLAVAALSLVAAFYREAATADTPPAEWIRLLGLSASSSLGAWLHLSGYQLWQFFAPALTPSAAPKFNFNQFVHFAILVLLGWVLAKIWFFWMSKQSSAQHTMRREGEPTNE